MLFAESVNQLVQGFQLELALGDRDKAIRNRLILVGDSTLERVNVGFCPLLLQLGLRDFLKYLGLGYHAVARAASLA